MVTVNFINLKKEEDKLFMNRDSLSIVNQTNRMNATTKQYTEKKRNWKNPNKIKMLLKFEYVSTELNDWDVTVNSTLCTDAVSTSLLMINHVFPRSLDREIGFKSNTVQEYSN